MTKVEQILQERGTEYREVGSNQLLVACTNCPPGKSNKLYIDKYKGVYICHRCESKGSLLGNSPAPETTETAAEEPVIFRERLTREFIDHLHNHLVDFPIGRDALKYLTRERALTVDTIKRFRLGFDPIKNAVAIANLDFDGSAAGITYRYLSPGTDLRYTQEPLGGQKKLPYNMVQAMSSTDHKEIHVTEGEFDCIVLQQMLPEVVVIGLSGKDSFPKAKNKDEIGLISCLKQYDQVYLYPDRELRAHTSFTQLAELVGRDKCFIVTLPHKDLNECLVKGMTVQELSVLQREASGATGRAHTDAFSLYQESTELFQELTDTHSASSGLDVVDDALGGLRVGELTLLAGDPKSGKSTLAFQVTHDVCKQGAHAIVCSLEMGIRRDIEVRMLSHAHRANLFREGTNLLDYKPPKYFERLHYLNPDHMVASVPAIQQTLRLLYNNQRLDRKKFVYLVIDNLTSFVAPPSIKPYEKTDWVGDRVLEIKQLTQEFPNLHVWLLCHLRKRSSEATSGATISDLFGSMKIQAACDNISLVQKPKDENDTGVEFRTDGTRSLSVPNQSVVRLAFDSDTTRLTSAFDGDEY